MELILLSLSTQSSQQDAGRPKVPVAPQQGPHLGQPRPQQPGEDGPVQERHRPGPGADITTGSEDTGDTDHQVGLVVPPVVPRPVLRSSLQE